MRYSANLNVIIKAIEKATKHLSRDFVEIENLQSNPVSANKFFNSSYNKIKEILIDEFSRFRADFNLYFADGQQIINQANSEYNLIIFPLDGVENLVRASPDFTVAIALCHRNAADKLESISVAISKTIGGELYYSEKGFGAYLNNRRLRVSKRTSNNANNYLIACDDVKISADLNIMPRNLGCRTLELCYLASARFDQVIFSPTTHQQFAPFTLLAKEAGARIITNPDKIIISNL